MDREVNDTIAEGWRLVIYVLRAWRLSESRGIEQHDRYDLVPREDASIEDSAHADVRVVR